MPPADPNAPHRLAASAYVLRLRQSPARGKVIGKDKDRKPLDPPPVVQLFVRDPGDPAQNYLQSPYYWMVATLWHETEDRPPDQGHAALCGSLTSSLHRLKDMDSAGQSRDGGFFVFGDLSCKVEGKYRLKIILYETLQGQVQGLAETMTQPFEVYNAKNFPGMAESTFMSRSFGDQGVRLRIRKESRQIIKRPASSYSPTAPPPQQLPLSSLQGGYGQHATAYQSPMHGAQYGQPYIKNEELEESAPKRQRSANTSPTGYYERNTYASMAPSSYNTQAYAGYGAAESLGPSPIAAMTGGLGYDSTSNAQSAYGYDATRNVVPIYGGRPTDPNSNAPANAYPSSSYSTASYPAGSYASPAGGYYGTAGSSGSNSGNARGWQNQGSS